MTFTSCELFLQFFVNLNLLLNLVKYNFYFYVVKNPAKIWINESEAGGLIECIVFTEIFTVLQRNYRTGSENSLTDWTLSFTVRLSNILIDYTFLKPHDLEFIQ